MQRSFSFIFLIGLLFVGVFLTNSHQVSAEDCQTTCINSLEGVELEDCMNKCAESGGTSPSFQTSGSEAQRAAKESGLDTSANATVEGKVATIVNYALSLIGVIFLILMVYGGFIWMLARGDEGEAKRAKNIITMGVIGMIIVIAAFAITTFVVNRLISAA